MGHILKENFDETEEGDFGMEKFHKELEENSVSFFLRDYDLDFNYYVRRL
jgi:hypothetical protein